MMQTYTYDFTDTANGEVNAAKLDDEISNGGPWSSNFAGVTIRVAAQQFDVLFEDPALPGGEVTALDAIIAAHVGASTENYAGAIRKIAADSNATGIWQNVLTLTTPALAKGWYRIVASCGMRTAAAPVTPFLDGTEARLQENLNAGGATTIQNGAALFERTSRQTMIRLVFAQHGDVLEYTLDHRRFGTATSEMRDASISIEPFDGPVSSP